MRHRPGEVDFTFLSLALALLVFGLVMLYSASGLVADEWHRDPAHFLKRQILWAGAGLLLMAALSKLDYNRLKEWAWPALGASAVGLLAVLFSPPVAGARRWIRLGPLGFQPSEFAKLALILFLADYADRKHSKTGSPVQGFIVPWAVVGTLLGLIALEPDLGTPVLLLLVSLVILFLGGARWRYVLGAACCAAPLVAYELLRVPYRRQRLAFFLQPWADPQGAGYQLLQALLATGSGGWLGKGLGGSQLKLHYLPAPHTDFIFPILAEELGLAGSVAVLGLFAALFVRGMRIARRAPNLFGELLAAGLASSLALQASFNIAMSVGLVPTKGVPLPFFSFGGSSLLVTLAGIGILLSVSRQARRIS